MAIKTAMGGLIAKLTAKPLLVAGGAALTFVVGLIIALTIANNRLDTARAKLAVAERDTLECVRANESNQRTIEQLVAESNRNRSQRDAALRAQQAAADRIAELEAEQDDETQDTIERVIRVADGDLCADTAIPDRLRDAAHGDRH